MRRRFRSVRLSALIGIAVCLSACSASSAPAGTVGQPRAIPTAANSSAEIYLQTAFLFVRDNYYYASQVNWSALERKVFQRAENAHTTSQTYPAIRYLLSSLRPSVHTYFLTPAKARSLIEQNRTGFGLAAVKQPDGLMVVADVLPNSPAAKADVRPGDVVLRVDHHRPPNTATSGFNTYGSTVTLQLQHRDQGPAFTISLRAAPIQPSQYPNGQLLPDGFGYLNLPTFGDAPQTPQAQTYATDAQGAIRSIAASSPCGWVVDLRENTGGDFAPMVVGVGPVLGNGLAGSFVNQSGARLPWSYQDGSITGPGGSMEIPNAYELPNPDPPVAVLTSGLTDSAGEATLISFLGRPNTRTFGTPTAGAPSSPKVMLLSDDAYLSVVTSVEADRTGHIYQDHVPIRPEQAVPPNWTQIGLNSDPTLAAAEAWLKAQPACAG